MLRKFFRSVLGLKIPVDLVEKMMGHSGYLTDAYVRHGDLTAKEYYQKHSVVLHIFGDQDISDLREQMAETVKTLEDTKEVQTKTGVALTSVVIENTGLKTELTTMKDQMDTMASAIRDMQELMTMVAGLPKEKRDALAKVGAVSQ
jgi:regulator of replication initiation timing